MSWAQKKRAMMMQAAAPAPSETPITISNWAIGKNISSTGTINNSAIAAYGPNITDDPMAAAAGATIKRTGSQTDGNGNNINMYIHEYVGRTWKQRIQLNVGSTVRLQSTAAGDAYTTNGIRITFAYGSGSGLSMSQAVIDAYYGAAFVG